MKRGIIHPRSNYSVVYRVTFAPRLLPDEEPLREHALRIGLGASYELPAERPPDNVTLWLLVTAGGCGSDGAPGLAFGPHPSRFPGPRDAAYSEVWTSGVEDVQHQGAPWLLLALTRNVGETRFAHGFWLAGDDLNRSLLDDVESRIREAQGQTREG